MKYVVVGREDEQYKESVTLKKQQYVQISHLLSRCPIVESRESFSEKKPPWPTAQVALKQQPAAMHKSRLGLLKKALICGGEGRATANTAPK